MIKRFNNESARLRKGQQMLSPMVSFTPGGGVVRMNRRLCELLQIKPADRVEVIHDEEADEWYVCKSASGLHLSNAGQGAAQFHSRVLMDAIEPYLPPAESKAICCPVAKIPNTLEGLECYAILGLVRP
jgi:hypothetical protein